MIGLKLLWKNYTRKKPVVAENNLIDKAELKRLGNDFYRRMYHRVMIGVIAASSVVLALAIAVVYLAIHQPPARFYASTVDGHIVPVTPLDQPNLRPDVLLRWASRAVVSVYTFDFVNINKQLENAHQYFTKNGWSDFLQSLNQSGISALVQKNQLFVSSVVSGTPVISNQGILGGHYTWRVQVPLLVTYQSAGEKIQKNFIVTLLITRISTLDSVEGIGIREFNM